MISVTVEGVDVQADAAQAACLLRGLSDPSRLIVVHHLLLGEHRVVDLTEHLGLAQSTVSKHLACLVECGLVTFRAEGRSSLYSLAYPDETIALLAAAEKLLMLTHAAATACPTARQ
ncbi:MAG: ArsR/SmtB family transcription factor [Propionibacteriaceae bacterium]